MRSKFRYVVGEGERVKDLRMTGKICEKSTALISADYFGQVGQAVAG
jgi:hypothetical protein